MRKIRPHIEPGVVIHRHLGAIESYNDYPPLLILDRHPNDRGWIALDAALQRVNVWDSTDWRYRTEPRAQWRMAVRHRGLPLPAEYHQIGQAA